MAYVSNFIHEYRIKYVHWVYQQALRSRDFLSE